MNQIVSLADGLRQGMRALASGVCVISGRSSSGERGAMTASSVTSISDSPPSLLVCINKTAAMDAIMRDSERFCVNVLGANNQDVSEICATPDTGEQRFEVGSWNKHEATSIDYIDTAPAVFVCSKQQVVDHGTHSIFIANIEEVLISKEKKPALVYADGQYHYL